MSQLNVDLIKNRTGTGGPTVSALTVTDGVLVGGALTVTGNFTVNGTQTIVNTQVLDVSDKNIGIGSTSTPSDALADGAGITIYGTTDKTLTWSNTTKDWTFVGGGVTTSDLSTQQLSVSGVSTVGFLTATNLSVSGVSTVGFLTATNLSVSGVSTVGFLRATNLSVSGVSTVGFLTATNLSVSGIATIATSLDLKGAVETVSVGSTYELGGGRVVLECDARDGTVFTHNLANGIVGITSLRNFPVTKNSATTFTILFTQNTTGTANTTALTGIGTNIRLTPFGVSGFTTTSRVATASTITLSTTARDVDIVSFMVHYNGAGTGTLSNYTVYATNNAGFRYGSVGF